MAHILIALCFALLIIVHAIGGLSPITNNAINTMASYQFTTQHWSIITPSTSVIPTPRYSHSASIVNGTMYMFGGRNKSSVFNELWSFNISTRVWVQLKPWNSNNMSIEPLPVYGHTATIANGKQFVLSIILALLLSYSVMQFQQRYLIRDLLTSQH